MNLLHHDHQYVPFDDTDDPGDDRRALKIEVGRLRREVHARDRRIAQLEAELRRVVAEHNRKWWRL